MKYILRTLGLGLVVLSSWAHASDRVEVHEAWVREAPPNVSILAAYLTLENHAGEARVLKQVTSTAFGHVEIHRTEMHDGMAHMIMLPEISVPPHDTLVFQQGGLHLMLFDPKHPLKAGDSVSLTLHFSDGSTLEVNAPVRKSTGGTQMQHDMDMHDHQHMH